MHLMTTTDLRTSLTLMIPEQIVDGEGGWRTEWREGPSLWASLAPLRSVMEADLMCLPPPRYRVIIRSEISLPPMIKFLWQVRNVSKYLVVRTAPALVHSNRFLEMTAMEEAHA